MFIFVHVEKIQTQDFKQIFDLFFNPMQNRPSPKPITIMKYLSSKTNTNHENCMNVVIWHVITKSQVFEKTVNLVKSLLEKTP